jgi:ribonuclease PH
VLVTATLEERLPPWLKGQGRAESPPAYGMLPADATLERTRRGAAAGCKAAWGNSAADRPIFAPLSTSKRSARAPDPVDCDVIR